MPQRPDSVSRDNYAGWAMTDGIQQTASDLGRAIGAGRIDPVDLTEGLLEATRDHPYADRISG